MLEFLKSFLAKFFLLVRAVTIKLTLTRQKSWTRPRTVVIVQLAKLGDMVCTTPMFRAVKRNDPNVKVVIVGNETNRRLLYGHPDVDEYIVFDKKNFQDTVGRLKAFHPDAGCLTGPDFNGLALLYMAGVKHVVVPNVVDDFCPTQTLSYRLLRLLATPVVYRFGQYMPRTYLRLLEPLGIYAEDTTKYLTYSKKAMEKITALQSSWSRPLIGLSVSAGNKIKNWPTERFAAVADWITEHYNATVVIVGGLGDHAERDGVLGAMRLTKQVADTTGLLDLDELKALISRFNLFIAVDTGPVYIAEAFDIPIVDIVGPVDEREQPPRGPHHRVVMAREGHPAAVHILNARAYNTKEARSQVESVTAEMVIQEVGDLMRYINIKSNV